MSDATYDLMRCSDAASAVEQTLFNVRTASGDPDAWDLFAQACGATFRGAYFGAFGWQFRHHLVFELRRYDIFACGAAEYKKIGQFMLGFGRKVRVFGDVLHLLPSYQNMWPLIMESVLRELGPGLYQYGSDWTTEPSRVVPIRAVSGATIVNEQAIDVYAVHFEDYKSWDELYKGLNSNVRRNVASAKKSGVAVEMRRDFAHSVKNTWEIFRLKRAMFGRKGLKLNSTRALAAAIFRTIAWKRYLISARSCKGSRMISLFSGVQFGKDLFYLEGASICQPGGAAWLLLISMLRRAFEESNGKGKCILGPDEKEARSLVAQVAWQNLLRQRTQCRAKVYPTSLVTFRYAGQQRKRDSFSAVHESTITATPLRIARAQ